jgi:hypothetical protein
MAISSKPKFDKVSAAKMADGPAPTIATWYLFFNIAPFYQSKAEMFVLSFLKFYPLE